MLDQSQEMLSLDMQDLPFCCFPILHTQRSTLFVYAKKYVGKLRRESDNLSIDPKYWKVEKM